MTTEPKNDATPVIRQEGETQAPQVCSCGRPFSHCKNSSCGSRNVYVKKARSFELSAQFGRMITVYGCRRCLRESTSEQPCEAPSRDFNPQFQAFVKPAPQQELPVWGLSLPGSPERGRLLNEWVSEMQLKKKWGRIQVYVEAQKQGWELDKFGEENIDPDVVQACKDQGLWPEDSKDAVVSSRGQPQAQQIKAPESNEASLDDIIKAMQEEQK